MSKPTAKAMRVKPAKVTKVTSSKPKVTQEQKDQAELDRRLSEVQPFQPLNGRTTPKEDAVKIANGLGETDYYLRRSLTTVLHALDVEIREHKRTKALLRKYQPKIKPCPKA